MAIRIMTAVWDTGLHQTEKLVLLAMADWANESGECWPCLDTIATRCSISKRTVSRTLAKLIEDGWLDRQHRGRGGTVYNLNLDLLGMKKGRQNGDLSSPKGRQCGDLSGSKRSPSTTQKVDICDIPIENRQEPSLKTQPNRSAASFEKIIHTDQGWFTAWWCYAFEITTGKKYFWGQGGRGGGDSAIVIALFRSAELDDIMERACCYMLLADSERWPEGPPSLFGFSQAINQLAGGYTGDTIGRCIDLGLHPDFSEFDQDLVAWQPWNENRETKAHA